VQVANSRSEDLLEAWAGFGAACVDDILCEVLVVLVGGRGGTGAGLGRHCGISCSYALCVDIYIGGGISQCGR
jgi:hypothetical protein